MFKDEITKNYKFKMNDILITVDLDLSFSDINIRHKPDIFSYIKHQHYHVAYELFFVEEKPLTVFTADNAIECKNCILCIPPKFNHLSFRQKDYRILFAFSEDSKSSGSFAQFIKSFSDFSSPQKLETDKLLMFYIRELSQILASKSSINDEIVTAILKLIFYKIYKLNTNNQNDTILSVSESYLVKIDNILNSFQNDINLQTVADALHLSPKQASRIIIKAYKKPFSALLSEKRLNTACLLLRHTENTISEIVEYINFPSESYFYKQFKKTYGCTPYKYKKMNAKKLHPSE